VSGIRTNAAAAMLGVSPNTLRAWERRYGFPRPHRSPGGHRQYALAEIEALRCAFAETLNVSSAIALAVERGEGPTSPARLAAALAGFDEAGANRLLEESLALRSIERTVEELLLPAVQQYDATSVEYDFAWRFAGGWLAAVKRQCAPPYRAAGVLILDASVTLELDALYAQALELMCRRTGLRVLLLSPATEAGRLGRALRALAPTAVVLSGRRISLDGIGQAVYAVRSVTPGAAIYDYRGAVPATGASTFTRLGERPIQARDRLLAGLEGRPALPRAAGY
jgi:MerR family transcriptional regulator, light-induced transcriptional regulator